MNVLTRHPSWRELNRLTDGEMDSGSRGPAMEHVAGCPRCSRNVSFLRDLREAGRDMRHPGPPKDLLQDIMRDRADGLRVILPVSGPPPRRGRRTLPSVAAVAALMAIAGVSSLFLVPEAGAGASELSFEPEHPLPGQEVKLSYRPGVGLAGETALRLRLRLRQAQAEPPRETLGAYDEVLLLPDREGRYAGSYRLPPDFAYALMAVEDLTGTHLDDRQGRLWSLSAYAANGEPRLAALRQDFLVQQSRNWPAARDVLHEMTLLYPDRAEGWSLQLSYEHPIQPPAEAAASLATHREIFRGLREQMDRRDPGPEELAAMARYARVLGDSEALGDWMVRLEAVDPAHPLVVSTRVAASRADESAGAFLERLWTEDGLRAPTIYRGGFAAAVREGDAEAARRWALRGLPLSDDHLWRRDAALALVAHPETRERGLAEIRDLLAHLNERPIEDRPLTLTTAEASRASRRLREMLQVDLGQQLLAAGEAASAIRELDAADELGIWSPDLYRARLEARLSVGDTVAAIPDFHRLDVDPVYSRVSVDSLRTRLPAMSRADLYAGRSLAEREIIRRMLANQDGPRGLPRIDLLTSTGQSRSLESLVAGRPTVLLLWDRRVFGSEADAAEVVRAQTVLAGGPSQLLWVTSEPASESLQAFRRAAGLDLVAYHDPRSDLAEALGQWGVRIYFVIDGAGRIRTHTYSLMEAVRQLEVLQLGSRDTA